MTLTLTLTPLTLTLNLIPILTLTLILTLNLTPNLEPNPNRSASLFFLGHLHRVGEPRAALPVNTDRSLLLLDQAVELGHDGAMFYLAQVNPNPKPRLWPQIYPTPYTLYPIPYTLTLDPTA